MIVRFYGQAPSREQNDRPFVGGRHGAFLAALASVPESVLAERFRFENVLESWPGKNGKGDAFPMEQARARACVLESSWRDGDRVVCAGWNVARAFGLRNGAYFSWQPFGAVDAAVFPHPSRVNRFWNDPGNVARAILFMQELVATTGEEE